MSENVELPSIVLSQFENVLYQNWFDARRVTEVGDNKYYYLVTTSDADTVVPQLEQIRRLLPGSSVSLPEQSATIPNTFKLPTVKYVEKRSHPNLHEAHPEEILHKGRIFVSDLHADMIQKYEHRLIEGDLIVDPRLWVSRFGVNEEVLRSLSEDVWSIGNIDRYLDRARGVVDYSYLRGLPNGRYLEQFGNMQRADSSQLRELFANW